jgi:hypothetical protein
MCRVLTTPTVSSGSTKKAMRPPWLSLPTLNSGSSNINKTQRINNVKETVLQNLFIFLVKKSCYDEVDCMILNLVYKCAYQKEDNKNEP